MSMEAIQYLNFNGQESKKHNFAAYVSSTPVTLKVQVINVGMNQYTQNRQK